MGSHDDDAKPAGILLAGLAAALRRLNLLLPALGYGRCAQCRSPWWAADPYDVEYRPGSSFFVCCQLCWLQLTLQQRLIHTRHLYERWQVTSGGDRLLLDMHDAVRRDHARLRQPEPSHA